MQAKYCIHVAEMFTGKKFSPSPHQCCNLLYNHLYRTRGSQIDKHFASESQRLKLVKMFSCPPLRQLIVQRNSCSIMLGFQLVLVYARTYSWYALVWHSLYYIISHGLPVGDKLPIITMSDDSGITTYCRCTLVGIECFLL